MNTITKHNLNLSPKYAPNWGSWEICREFICNALDADPEGYTAATKGSDMLTITTRTAPNMAELFMIGEGSKSATDNNIGQFGEGAKIAALAATRGGNVEIYIPGSKITFSFDDVFGAQSMFATIEDDPFELGCKIIIRYPGIASASSGRILGIKGSQPLNKAEESIMQVYCKGVWICQHNANSLFDWNIDELKLNRDRSAVAGYGMTTYISSYGLKHLTEDQWLQVVKSDGVNVEIQSLEYTSIADNKQKVRTAWETAYGSNAIMSCDIADNAMLESRAKQSGMRVVSVSVPSYQAFRNCGIRSVDELKLSSDGFESIDTEPYKKLIKQLRKLDPIIGAPTFSLSVFKVNANKDINGMADMAENRVWVSEALFIAGDMHRLVQVYLHEVAHLLCGQNDGTRSFENSLDWIAATFAMKVLDK